MKSILFIRHAEGKANAEGIMMGSSKAVDRGLSDKGRRMASNKARELKQKGFNPTIVFCSEMPRTQQTVKTIVDTLGINPKIIILPELNERSFGIYEGKPYQEAIDAFSREGDSPKTMETVSDFITRILKGFEAIKDSSEANTLVVTHSNPLAVIRSYLYYPADLNKYWQHESDNYVSGFEIKL